MDVLICYIVTSAFYFFGFNNQQYCLVILEDLLFT
jgi:hypothetical protein